jgi:hypothetical protein
MSSAEMPSAGRPFSVRVLGWLARRGVGLAEVTLHCGVSSTEAGEPPPAEWYRVPAGTAPADLGNVTLRPGATLAGRVVDPRGQAGPGGEVFLLDQPAGPNEMDRALNDRKPAATVAADSSAPSRRTP